MVTAIVNGRIVDGEIKDGCALIFSGSRIITVCPVTESAVFGADEIIDAVGHFVSPGFIDLHTHGACGCDFLDATPEAFIRPAEFHAKHGTTALCPTMTSGDMSELKKAICAYQITKNTDYNGAAFIGLHLEGPYFAKSQCGAQDKRYIIPPSPEQYENILAFSKDIVRWSAAPELPGAYEFAKRLRSAGILVSAAHTDADALEIFNAFNQGFTHMTHLYSCMTGTHRENGYRIAGGVEAAYLIDGMTVEIIADGAHLPPELLKLVYKIKGPDKTALITDSMRGAGMPEGSKSIIGSLTNGQTVFIEDGVAKMSDRQAFAGSVATFDRLVRNMTCLADISLTDAVRMATTTPAKIIGCHSKGSLAPGYDADIVIFDDFIDIKRTIVGGKTVYKRKII